MQNVFVAKHNVSVKQRFVIPDAARGCTRNVANKKNEPIKKRGRRKNRPEETKRTSPRKQIRKPKTRKKNARRPKTSPRKLKHPKEIAKNNKEIEKQRD